MQNFAARLLSGKRKFDHITKLLPVCVPLYIRDAMQIYNVRTIWPLQVSCLIRGHRLTFFLQGIETASSSLNDVNSDSSPKIERREGRRTQKTTGDVSGCKLRMKTPTGNVITFIVVVVAFVYFCFHV